MDTANERINFTLRLPGSPSKGWDDKYNALDQPVGSYVWIISLVDVY